MKQNIRRMFMKNLGNNNKIRLKEHGKCGIII